MTEGMNIVDRVELSGRALREIMRNSSFCVEELRRDCFGEVIVQAYPEHVRRFLLAAFAMIHDLGDICKTLLDASADEEAGGDGDGDAV